MSFEFLICPKNIFIKQRLSNMHCTAKSKCSILPVFEIAWCIFLHVKNTNHYLVFYRFESASANFLSEVS